ncbi:MAG: hypothetical protein QOH54_5782 [Mycobacterium sp.]|jgi:hypothetical protein|nr:hypothetical protein [Mycobacterium sp.]
MSHQNTLRYNRIRSPSVHSYLAMAMTREVDNLVPIDVTGRARGRLQSLDIGTNG